MQGGRRSADVEVAVVLRMLDSSGFVVLDERYDPKCTAERVNRVLSALKGAGRHRKCQEMERFCHVYQPIKEKCAADKDLVHADLSAALVQHLKEENALSRGHRGRVCDRVHAQQLRDDSHGASGLCCKACGAVRTPRGACSGHCRAS